MKTLILKHFEIRWNKWCPNQVLKKLVKLASSLNVNSLLERRIQTKTLCSLQGVFFYYVTFSPSRSVRCETKEPPAMRVRIEGYTQKLQTRYN